jgi:hypothetical protein
MQAEEQLQNGIVGFRPWRNELGAGLQVALVMLSPGIAVASGAPPISGKMTASQGRPGTSQPAACSTEISCLN